MATGANFSAEHEIKYVRARLRALETEQLALRDRLEELERKRAVFEAPSSALKTSATPPLTMASSSSAKLRQQPFRRPWPSARMKINGRSCPRCSGFRRRACKTLSARRSRRVRSKRSVAGRRRGRRRALEHGAVPTSGFGSDRRTSPSQGDRDSCGSALS